MKAGEAKPSLPPLTAHHWLIGAPSPVPANEMTWQLATKGNTF